MAESSSAKIASFCAGGRPCLRRMPASTVGDMAVAEVERLAELAVAPANPGKPPLERGDATLDAGPFERSRPRDRGRRCQGSGGSFVKTLAPQPGGELPPIGIIGARGVSLRAARA